MSSAPLETPRTVRIGLTGPIGCGKSTIAGWLSDLGALVIDADAVAREVTEPGTAGLAAVASAFGPEVLRPDGSLDRAALGRIVFSDPESLVRLEAVVHPAVRPVILERIDAARRSGAPAVVIEAIKLVEGGLAALCDEVWLVTCSADQQLERLIGRGADRTDAAARIEAQSGIVDRLTPAATRIIETSGALPDVRLRVKAAYRAALGHEAP